MTERRHSDSAIEVEDNKQRRDSLIDFHTAGGDTSLIEGEFVESRMHSGIVERRKDGLDAEEQPRLRYTSSYAGSVPLRLWSRGNLGYVVTA